MAESYCNPFSEINARLPKNCKLKPIKIDDFNTAPLQPIAEAAAGCMPAVVTSSFPYRADGKLTYQPVAVILSFDQFCDLVNGRERERNESVEYADSISPREELEHIASGVATRVKADQVETADGPKWRVVRTRPAETN